MKKKKTPKQNIRKTKKMWSIVRLAHPDAKGTLQGNKKKRK